MSARKIGFLILILIFGAIVELSWQVRESNDWSIGPEGCRVLGGRFYGPSFEFEETAERELRAEGPYGLDVTNAFGDVRVVAGDGPTVRVKLRKVVFQPTEGKARDFARLVELRLEEDDGRLRVGTNRDDLARDRNVGFETHLELQVPPQTRAVVRSDHGAVEVSGIASADIRTSFDDVRVEKIAGAVKIDCREGMVEATDLAEGLTLKLRHGEADVTDVAGPADIDLQHGQLRARGTAGLEVKVAFAEVVISQVQGDVVVDGRRTALRVSDVSGRVEAETSFNDARFERVGGDLRAKVDRGAVIATAVKGSLTAESSHGGVELEGIGGPVQVTARRGGVTAEGLQHGGHVRGWDDDVSIVGFRGPIDVGAERGNVVLSPGSPITDTVTASAKEGGVRLEVPPGSRFELEARSGAGDVVLDVSDLDAEKSDAGRRARGVMGGGGAKVRVTADEDVTLADGAVHPPAEEP